MTTSSLRRLLLATGSTIFLALALTAATPKAQTSDHPPTCGGRDQTPCTVFSLFWNENFGVCDRGLKVDFLANRCINSTRRQGKGAEFRNTWTGRALRIQQDQLAWDEPIGRFPMLMARNAYQNDADGYLLPAQKYSMTELLDAGVRALRLEVHASMDDQTLTGQYPEMCMSDAIAVGPVRNDGHFGCVITDRWLANGLREIREWMVEPGHERDVVLLVIDMRVDQARTDVTQYDTAKVMAPINEYFANDSRIGLLDDNDVAVNVAWPSRAWMLARGKRVGIMSTTNKVNFPNNGWPGSVRPYPKGFGFGEYIEPFPACNLKLADDVRRDTSSFFSKTPISSLGALVMLDGVGFKPGDLAAPGGGEFEKAIYDHYPTYGNPSASDLRSMMKCGVGLLGLNQLLDPAQDPNRVRGMIWSFADDEPVGAGGNGAMMRVADGRWVVRPITDPAAFVCRKTDGAWKVTTGEGPLTDGLDACVAAGASFVPPTNAQDNEKARAAVAAAGETLAWVNYVSLGGDYWTTANTPQIVAFDPFDFGGIFEQVPMSFSLAWTVPATSVDWDFGDNTPIVTVQAGQSSVFPFQADHTFAKYGSYTVTARIHVGGSDETISRTFEVRQQSDLPFLAQITLDDPPARQVEGWPLRLGVSSWWPIVGARCRPGASITAPESPAPEPRTVDGKTRYDAVIYCLPKATDGPRVDVEILAGVIDPNTGQPAIDPATGQVAVAIGKHFHFDLQNDPPYILSFELQAPAVQAFQPAEFLLRVEDAEGEHLTATVHWPSGTGTETFDITSEYTLLTHVFTFPDMTAQKIRVSVSDGDATTEAEFDVLVNPNAVEIVTKTGPTTVDASPSIGRHYDMDIRNTGGGTITGTSGSCGDTGIRVAGPTFVQHNADGTDHYGMLCRFPVAGTNTVTMSFTNSFGLGGSDSFQVSVTAAADTTPPTFPALPPITLEATALTTPVTFTVTATDNKDPNVQVTCDPASGTQFAVGATTVNCTATDAAENHGSGHFTVTITDTTGPVITVPAPITREATGGAGTVVTFIATAFDAVDGGRPVSCSPASGSTFPIGTTTVNCSASDTRGNAGAPRSFTVTVGDSTRPVVTVPAAITREALTGAGAAVTFVVSAADSVDGPLTPVCSKPSGFAFPLGTTTVSCTAKDAHDNVSEPAAFTVTIADTTAPSFGPVANVTVEATSSAGAVVAYASPIAQDAVSGAITATCSPVSGTTFPTGSTPVNCTATDGAGHANTVTFTVTVRGATEQAAALQQSSFGVGPGNSVASQAADIAQALAAGQTADAISKLHAFINHVKAQSGKKIPAAQAAALIAQAQRIIDSLR